MHQVNSRIKLTNANLIDTFSCRREEAEEEAKLKEELKELRLLLQNPKLTTQISKLSVISNQSFE